jgi:hypothetical protein
MTIEKNYYLPLYWQLFDSKTTEFDEYFIGVKKVISDVLVSYEVLPKTYIWNPKNKMWIDNNVDVSIDSVICVAKKYPIVYPKDFRI